MDDNGRWRVRSSRVVVKDRWIALRADDCVTPAGVEVAPYYVLDYPDFVHVLAVTADGRVVMVEQYRHGLGATTLELPGGTMDAGEDDPVRAAMRELREETGYDGPAPRLLASLSVDPAKMANRVHLIALEGAEPRHATAFDEAEAIALRLVPAAELAEQALRGAIVNAAHTALVLIGLKALGRLPA